MYDDFDDDVFKKGHCTLEAILRSRCVSKDESVDK